MARTPEASEPDTLRAPRMARAIDALYNRVDARLLIGFAVALVCVAGVNFAIYFAVFLPLTDGTAYMELNLGYTSADLFRFAEFYGAEGRRLYVVMSSTFDALIPFLASSLLVMAAYLLEKRAGRRNRLGLTLAMGVCCCASDWSENLCMIVLLTLYPVEYPINAALARTLTTCKYLFMVASITLIVFAALDLRRSRRAA